MDLRQSYLFVDFMSVTYDFNIIFILANNRIFCCLWCWWHC